MLSSIGSRVAADPEELHFRREARSRFVRTFLRYPAALPALILFVIVVLCALGAPLLTQYTPFEGNAAERLQGIGTAGHLLGTDCLLYTSPSPRDGLLSRMPSSA